MARPATDRKVFEEVLSEIFAGLDKPFTEAKREALWRGCGSMSAIELGRIRDRMFEDAAKGDVPRSLGVRELWVTLRELRARAPTVREEEPEWPGGGWEIRANDLLLSHIRKQASLGVHYCSKAWRSQRLGTKWTPDVETAALTGALVEGKRQWAEAMRCWIGKPTAEEQQDLWNEAMSRAEAKCRKIREENHEHSNAD